MASITGGDAIVTAAPEERSHLGIVAGAGGDRDLLDAHTGGDGVGDDMHAVQQQHVLVVAPRRGPKPRDDRVLTAGDRGHASAPEG